MNTLKLKFININSLMTLLLVAIIISGCKLEHESIVDTTESPRFEALDKLFTDYQVVTLANEEILTTSKEKKEEGFLLDLMIEEKPNWSFNVEFHNFYGDDYKAYESDMNGNWVQVETPERSDAFHGQSLDKENKAMFIIKDNNFSGEIYEGDIQYSLEPLSVFVPTASANQYVYYRLDADINSKMMECGNTSGNHLEHSPTGVEMRLNQCREMTVTYVADYEYYQEFGSNSSSTRTYIEDRLKFGSYRYWAYNNYPLYFKLWASYIKTNTSNRPATSTNSSTFLSQWRTWGRAGNIGQADANLLYTGRDFGTLFGRAYLYAVCNYSGSQRTAYGIVTKNSGISSGVYSKVTAHEVGHMLGANHQSSGFMQQGNHSNTSMPQSTRNELDAHISNYNSCMPLRTCVNYQ